MRIGIDTAPILQHQNRGVGALGSHLLHALLRSEGAHRYLLFTPDSARGLSAELSEPQNFEVIHRPPAGGAFSWAWVRDAMRLRRQVKRQRLDVFHAYFQWNLPLRRFPVPVVGHIYDLMPIAVREIYAGRYSLPVDRKIGLYARYLKFALRRIDRAISISEHTRRDLIRLTGFPEEQTHVVHPAPAPGMAAPDDVGVIHALRERLGLREDYLLYVGGYDYRKNLEMLLWAFSRARKEGMNLMLALAGDMSSSYGQLIQTLVEEAGDESGVRTLGHIADGDLPALYAGARLFCIPIYTKDSGSPFWMPWPVARRSSARTQLLSRRRGATRPSCWNRGMKGLGPMPFRGRAKREIRMMICAGSEFGMPPRSLGSGPQTRQSKCMKS